jgi:hypothetical protein
LPIFDAIIPLYRKLLRPAQKPTQLLEPSSTRSASHPASSSTILRIGIHPYRRSDRSRRFIGIELDLGHYLIASIRIQPALKPSAGR